VDLSVGPRWLGVLLAGVGTLFIFWSGVALGRLYSPEVTVQEGHHLVTSGPYRFVRHPRYAGGIALILGMVLVFRSWVGLLVAVAFVAILGLRIRDEEALMRQEFGAEWDAYCRRSWRLIPRVY